VSATQQQPTRRGVDVERHRRADLEQVGSDPRQFQVDGRSLTALRSIGLCSHLLQFVFTGPRIRKQGRSAGGRHDLYSGRGRRVECRERTMKTNISNEQRAAKVLADARWAAVVGRDPNADGRFFYSVRTTGVYCRPSCPSRAARPENVLVSTRPRPTRRRRVFAPAGAVSRTSRACPPRTRTRSPSAVPFHRGVRASADARRAGAAGWHEQLSPAPRNSRRSPAVTPRAYAGAHRARRLQQELKARRHGHRRHLRGGLQLGPAGFYEEADQLLGMTPHPIPFGGAGTEIQFAIGQCSLGSILVARSARGLCSIMMGDDPAALAHELHDRFRRLS